MGSTVNMMGTAYESGQGGRVRMMQEEAEQYRRDLEQCMRIYEDSVHWHEKEPDVCTAKEVAMNRQMMELAQAKYDAIIKAMDPHVQQGTTQETYKIADDISAKGAQHIEKAKDGLGIVGSALVDAAATTTQMGIDYAANALLGIPKSMVPFVTRSFGSSTQEARQAGADLEGQLRYAALNVPKEYFTEKITNIALPFAGTYGDGGLDGILKDGIQRAVDKLAKTDLGKWALGGILTWGAGSIGEGFEEFVSDWLGWKLPKIAYGGDTKSAGEMLGESLYDALVGYFAGGMGGGIDASTYHYGVNAGASTETATQVQTTNTVTIPTADSETATLQKGVEASTIRTSSGTGAEGQKLMKRGKAPNLSRQEAAQVRSAQMQKFGTMDETDTPQGGYVFAHDMFYVLLNYGPGNFRVTMRLDPSKKPEMVNEILEGIKDGDAKRISEESRAADEQHSGDDQGCDSTGTGIGHGGERTDVLRVGQQSGERPNISGVLQQSGGDRGTVGGDGLTQTSQSTRSGPMSRQELTDQILSRALPLPQGSGDGRMERVVREGVQKGLTKLARTSEGKLALFNLALWKGDSFGKAFDDAIVDWVVWSTPDSPTEGSDHLADALYTTLVDYFQNKLAGDKATTTPDEAKTELTRSDDGSTIKGLEKVSLADDERAALLDYKSSWSYIINAMLRDGSELDEVTAQKVEAMDRAIQKLPRYSGTVYRRIAFDEIGGQEALDAFLAEHQPGEFVRYSTFTSASQMADGYPIEGKNTVLLILEGQRGYDMQGVGNNFELEVLFGRGAVFEIIKVEQDEFGRPVIFMREVLNSGNK